MDEDHGVTVLEAAEKLDGVDGGGVLRAEVGTSRELSVRSVSLRDTAEVVTEAGDVVAGEGVVDPASLASGLDQPGFAEGRLGLPGAFPTTANSAYSASLATRSPIIGLP